MARHGRSLTDDEAALWDKVAATAVPLREKNRPIGLAKSQANRSVAPNRNGTPRVPSRFVVSPSRGPGQIERRTTRRIVRGTIELDARLDLHGLTQAEAHARLIEFVSWAQQAGHRTVLIITGKGAGDGSERGILRRALPQWLSTSPLRNIVSGFDPAHRSHGGAGAFYLRINRVGRVRG